MADLIPGTTPAYDSSGETGGNLIADKINVQTGLKEARDWADTPSKAIRTLTPSVGVLTLPANVQGNFNDYTLSSDETWNATPFAMGNVMWFNLIVIGSPTITKGTGITNDYNGLFGNELSPGTYRVLYATLDTGGVDFSVPQLSNDQLDLPANFQASAGDEQVALSWSSVQSATGYVLEFHDGDLQWSSVPTYDGTSTSYLHESLTNQTQYFYRVKATALGYVDSSYSQTNATPDEGVTQLTAITLNSATPANGQVTLAFINPNSNNEDDNLIQYSEDNFVADIVNGTALATGAVSGVQAGLTNGVLYYFRLIARGSGVYTNSDPSNVLSTTPASGIILLTDDFTGTTIDITTNWDFSNPDTPYPTISQNNELIGESNDVGATSALFANNLLSKSGFNDSYISLAYLHSTYIDTGTGTPNGGWTPVIYVDTNNRIGFAAYGFGGTPNYEQRLVIVAGGVIEYNFDTGISAESTRWKVDIDGSNMIRFYYYNSGWVQAGTTQGPFDIGTTKKILLAFGNSDDSDYEHSIDAVRVTNAAYSTEFP